MGCLWSLNPAALTKMIPITIGTAKYLYGSASRIVGFKKFFIAEFSVVAFEPVFGNLPRFILKAYIRNTKNHLHISTSTGGGPMVYLYGFLWNGLGVGVGQFRVPFRFPEYVPAFVVWSPPHPIAQFYAQSHKGNGIAVIGFQYCADSW